jgi:hypothetical protein
MTRGERFLRSTLLLLVIAASSKAAILWSDDSGTLSGMFPTVPTPEEHAMGPITYTITCSGNAAELQAAYDAAWLGDTIKLTAGCEYGYPAGHFTRLTHKTNGSGRITITTTEDARLPKSGTRITPAYLPLMPVLHRTDNQPMIGLAGYVGRPGVEHITIRGLAFRPTPGIPFDTASAGQVLNYGYIYIGGGEGWRDDDRSVAKPAGTTPWADTRLSADAAAGDSTITVADTTGFAVGERFFLYKSTTVYTYPYTPTSVNHDTRQITFTPPLLEGHNAGSSVWLVSMDKPATLPWQPNDIVIQHCVLTNPEYYNVARLINLNGRAVVIRDNFIAGSNHIIASDGQGIAGSFGIGPYVIENNAIIGGTENIMFGGAIPATDTQLDSATIRFNWLAHTPERDRMWLDWCQLYNACTSAEGADKVGRDYGMSNIIKTPRLIFRGAQISSTGTASGPWFQAMNTGYVAEVYSVPSFASVPVKGTFTSGGVTFRRFNAESGNPSGLNKRNLIKNNFEIKAARNVLLQYNVLDWFPDASAQNTQQSSIINIKATNGGDCVALWPTCQQPRTRYIRILNNKMITAAGGMNLVGTTNTPEVAGHIGDYLVQGNLLIQAEPVTSTGNASILGRYVYFTAASSRGAGGYGRGSTPNVKIRNNTAYDPFPHTHYATRWETGGTDGGWFPGAEFTGNIMPRGSMSWRQSLTTVETVGGLQVFPCNGSLTGCREFSRNVIVGAPTAYANFPAATVLGNCSYTAACVSGSTEPPWDYYGNQAAFNNGSPGKLFRNRLAGDLRISNHHRFAKRSMPDGSDIGADMSRVPDIRRLTVTPSDRAVLFRWSVTQPIRDIPCVIEVHTSPDFENDFHYDPGNPNNRVTAAYAGETGQISTYYRQDADDANRNIRSGLSRMLIVGHTVSLTPSTTYFYRLQCGGDARRGYFKTLTARTGTGTVTITSAIDSTLTWGPSFSRTHEEDGDPATNPLTGGGEAGKSCTNGSCTYTFSANRGTPVYYRIGTGRVSVTMVP